MISLDTIFAKDISDITDQEKKYLKDHESQLTDDQKKIYKDILGTNEKETEENQDNTENTENILTQ